VKSVVLLLAFLPALAWAAKSESPAPEKMSAPAASGHAVKAAPSTEKRVLPGLKK
jgi:hypothetical protein